jgi:hypothetical protein
VVGFDQTIGYSFADDPTDYINTMRGETRNRQTLVFRLVKDLYDAALSLGQTPAQANAKINDLFNAYPGEWATYVIIGADGLISALQNDATLPWLDAVVAGVSIRQRLINRLS